VANTKASPEERVGRDSAPRDRGQQVPAERGHAHIWAGTHRISMADRIATVVYLNEKCKKRKILSQMIKITREPGN
jgi:hypothetical protein